MAGSEQFKFRDLHPNIFLGTASDRYAGWIGQIYSAEKYLGRIGKRSKKMKGKSFIEETLPVDSIVEYFEHFSILEIDYTFYRLLLDDRDKPTPNFFLLKQYGSYLKDDDRLFLKVPQIITAKKIWQGTHFAANDLYLKSDCFTEQFYKPALSLLGNRIKGFIFEQEYHRKNECLSEEGLVCPLEDFFGAIPRDDRYHLELRTESYLRDSVFTVMEKYGVGQVLSHWTWLPPLERQFKKSGGHFLNSGRQALIRLMTPRNMRYEDAYEKAYPFNTLVEGMLQPRMIEETVSLVRTGLDQNIQMNIIINNRSGGNAPLVAEKLSEAFSD